MISTQQLPACYRHIKSRQTADILYTLAKYASPNHLENTDAHEFHSLLCAAHIITLEHPLHQKQDTITCFQVISEYHCGHLCSMCPYSSHNKNRLEAEESILLSYALKDFSSFQFLKKSRLNAEHFQALFLLNDAPSGKIVAPLPLFWLSYSYISHTGNAALAFNNLPSLIANALDENNRGKLLPQNVQNIKTYLERLQAQCKTTTREKMKKPLSCVLYPETLSKVTISQYIAKEDSLPSSSESSSLETSLPEQSGCIDGLLASPNVKPAEKKLRPQFDIPIAEKRMEFHADIAVPQLSERPALPSEPDNPAEENLFYPVDFSVHEADRIGYPFYSILENAADLRQLEVFLQFNPLVGIELVTDGETGNQMLLLCASNQFYYIPVDSDPIRSLFHLYFSKSSIRRQICMDSYKLYDFLQHNGVYCQNVYSLRTAYRVLSEAKGQKGLNLGLSYQLNEIADTQNLLFDLNNELDFQFHYTNVLKLKEGMYSVTFTFSHEKSVQSLVMDILYCISRKNLAHIYGYRLLRFSQDSFTIATAAEYYGQLCEIVANLSTYLAEKRDLVPLIIKEDTIK